VALGARVREVFEPAPAQVVEDHNLARAPGGQPISDM